MLLSQNHNIQQERYQENKYIFIISRSSVIIILASTENYPRLHESVFRDSAGSIW